MNLDDLLHQASEALTSRTSGATPTDPSHGGPARSVAIVGLGAVFAALVGLAVYGVTQTSDEPDSAAVMADEGADAGAPSEATTPIAAATSEDSAEDNAQLNMSDTDANEVSAAADETASSVPEGAWVSDGVPVDLALTRSVAEAEMGEAFFFAASDRGSRECRGMPSA